VFAAVRAGLEIDKGLYDWWFYDVRTINQRAKALTSLEEVVIVREEVARLLGLPWTAAFTSAIDSTTRRLFRIPEIREVHQIFRPAGERGNAGSVPVFRLFGSVDRLDPEELPPSSGESDLRRRRRVASSMLEYLPEIVGGGNVFIEGWWPSTDWLRPRDLSQALAAFGQRQVFLFGADDTVLVKLLQDEDFNELIRSDIVVPVRSSVADVVTKLRDIGELGIEDERGTTATKVFYPVAKSRPQKRTAPSKEMLTSVVFPRLEWHRLSDGEVILTDLNPSKPLPASPDGLREAFGSFARGEIAWQWLDHLAFRRPILDSLLDQCFTASETQNPEEHTIVLYGQSGSGKSVLLRMLALELRRMGLPVIFSRPGILPVNREHVEAFCEAVSAVSSAPVYFISDSTRDDGEYLELSSYLASRARSCVVVGSSYPSQRVGTRRRRGAFPILHPIILPVKLETVEGEKLLAHLSRFVIDGDDTGSTLSRFLGTDISNFFATIYRLLPESRARGRAGIVSEITESSRKLQQRLKQITNESRRLDLTAMGYALRNALGEFLADRVQEITAPQTGDKGSEDLSEALRLINAVMVGSQLGLQVPQSLALRLIGHNIPAYRNSVQGDIIEVCEVRQGDTALQARHSLEASIWVTERLSKVEEQFALIEQLVKQIRDSEIRDDPASIELEFVAQVLRALGPQGDERFRRPQLYMEIARLVSDLRSLHGDVHPRLLLIESNAIREGIKQQRVSPTLSLDDRRAALSERVKKLESAENGLEIAQEMVSKDLDGLLNAGARRLLATLATERAGVVGFMIGSLHRVLPGVCQQPAWARRADQWLDQSRTSWREALSYDASNIQAIDTACWIFEDRFQVRGLSLEQEAELFADWSEIIERYNEHDDLSPKQFEMRDQREATLANLMGDLARFDSVAKRAAARGSHAVHTLKARWLEAKEGSVSARAYLEEHCDAARFLSAGADVDASDRGTLLLYSRLWWRTETSYESYFPEERLCLGFSRERWEQLLNLNQARLRLEGDAEHATPLFLSACALVHLGRTEDGQRILDHLDRLGVGGRRRSRALVLLTDEGGNPRQLTAEFQGRRRGKWLLAWCDDLRTNVPFNPFEMVGPAEIRSGRRIGPFHLSFRFRGLYAEPMHRLTTHRRSTDRLS